MQPAGKVEPPPADTLGLLSCDEAACYAFLGRPDPDLATKPTHRLVRPVVAAVIDRDGMLACNATLTAAVIDATGATLALAGEAHDGCAPTLLEVALLDGSPPVSVKRVDISVTDPDLALADRGQVDDVAVGPERNGVTHIEVTRATKRSNTDVPGYIFGVYVVRTGSQVRIAILFRAPGFETTQNERGVVLHVLELAS